MHAMRPLLAASIVALLGIASGGCGGASRSADAQWSEESFDQTQHKFRDTEVLNPTPLEPMTRRHALVGVRHDLMLSNAAPKEARCSCLAVEVGRPRDPKFFWQGDLGDVAPDALVIALGAQGVPCPGGPAEGNRRPSISAVDMENNDILVEVEDLAEGKPIASGAILPRPGPGGSIYVRPRNQNVIYGRSPGGWRCRVR
jgi:hypothetical protein